MKRRVVVTGMGAVTPLGNTLVESWRNLLQNVSGVTTLEEALRHQNLPDDILQRELELAEGLPCSVAAPVRDVEYDPRTSRFVLFALMAGKEALGQAELLDTATIKTTTTTIGASIGSGMSSVREVVESSRVVQDRGLRRLSPHFVPRVLSNSAAGRLGVEYGLTGPNLSQATACAASAHSIGDATRCIQYGDADIMVAGGAEAAIDPLSLNGFCRLRALSSNADPEQASRPFDSSRDGFVMGEGAAVLVLEERDHALRRGVPILAELVGYGLSGDGHHITSPDPDGSGAKRSMLGCLASVQNDANIVDGADPISKSTVGYINAHATSTPVGDDIEARAIDEVFGADHDKQEQEQQGQHQGMEQDSGLLVSSTKGATGHLLGAAGSVEAAFTIMSLIDGIVPPTRNLINTEANVSFHHVHKPIQLDGLTTAMTNSFGFGGTNASLLFHRTQGTKR